MNILVVNYEYPPIGGGGGSCCKDIAERLSEMGHNVDVFTAGYKEFKKFEQVKDRLRIFKIKSNRKSEHEVGFFGLVSFVLRGMFKIGRFIKKGNYDVIHYHFSVPTGLLTFFHTKKIPYIITLHGIDVPGFHEDEFPLFQKLTKPFNKTIIKRASKVVAVSKNLRDKALKSFPGKEVEVIYHGVDKSRFKNEYPRNKNGKVRFICVSRLVSFKRIELLIKSFAILKEREALDCELTIVGTGYLSEELKALALKLGVDKDVTFTGFIDNTKLPPLLSLHDIFVMPSVHDSFGIVFIEAMACGLACIGANAAGVPEVISHGKNGFLAKPNDEESLFECMSKLAKDKELVKEMAQEGMRLVREKYTWDIIVEQYESLFKEASKK
jgi:glycosyltransferase involved in cell wall biosynthesis